MPELLLVAGVTEGKEAGSMQRVRYRIRSVTVTVASFLDGTLAAGTGQM
jgi:hypothetical protein